MNLLEFRRRCTDALGSRGYVRLLMDEAPPGVKYEYAEQVVSAQCQDQQMLRQMLSRYGRGGHLWQFRATANCDTVVRLDEFREVPWPWVVSFSSGFKRPATPRERRAYEQRVASERRTA